MSPSTVPPMMCATLPRRGTALLMALTAALLLLRLGQVPLVGPDEPRYARVAVEMRRSGDLVTPRLQGQPWLEKPVLYYWLAGLAYGLVGETEVGARLPSVIACLLFVGATALAGARLYGSSAGLHTGFILATAPLPFAYGRAASMDMLLAALVTAAIVLFGLRLLRIAGRSAIVVGYALMALGTLAKGPIAIVLVSLAVGGFILATRDWRALREVLSPIGILVFLLIALPWHVLVYQTQGQRFIDDFFWNHNLERFTSTVHRHPGPIYYYLPIVLVSFFPWSGLLVPALRELRVGRRDLFVILWLALPFLFFSVAGSKLPGYVLPCLPPVAILMGRAADHVVRQGMTGIAWRLAALTGLVLGTICAVLPLVLRDRHEPAWALIVPAGSWALVLAFAFSRILARDPVGSLRLLRVGAPGFLVLLTLAAPTLVAHQESGRDLFIPARGREVLTWGAWRTNWMAGYFYNDGRVREVAGLPDVLSAAAQGPILVLSGPAERRRLEKAPELTILTLARGPRRNELVLVQRRAPS